MSKGLLVEMDITDLIWDEQTGGTAVNKKKCFEKYCEWYAIQE